MLSVDEALAKIVAEFKPLASEQVALALAGGRVLAEDVYAAANVPAFANSSMDGYAVQAADTAAASAGQPVSLQVVGNIAAGYASDKPLAAGETMRIMTGAPLPAGADAVVRLEDTNEAATMEARHHQGIAAIADQPAAEHSRPASKTVQLMVAVSSGNYTRAAGEDIRAGELVLKEGTLLRPAEVGVLASLGRATVPLRRKPKVAIISTGDELIEPGQPLDSARGQIHNSNGYALAAAVTQAGGEVLNLGIARDNVADLTAKLDAGVAAQADLFLTSAGVSYGDYDIVKNLLIERGQMNFWQVRLRPGKPLVFGRLDGVPLLGLPGNPVSALVGFDIFVRPVLNKLLGLPERGLLSLPAILDEEIRNEPSNRRFYCRVVVSQGADGQYHARSSGAQGSGILTSLTRANAYLVIPEGVDSVPAGSVVSVLLFD